MTNDRPLRPEVLAPGFVLPTSSALSMTRVVFPGGITSAGAAVSLVEFVPSASVQPLALAAF